MTRTSQYAHPGTLALCLALFWSGVASAGVVVRAQVGPGVYGWVKNARVAGLECRPPAGDAAKPFLEKFLAQPGDWRRYRGRISVAIPFEQLNPDTQRCVMLAIFTEDVVSRDGWWHTVQFAGAEGLETVWTLCEWLTGKGTDARKVAAHPLNVSVERPLKRGQRIFIPADLLRPAMRTLTPERFNLLKAMPTKPGTPPMSAQELAPDTPQPQEREVDLEAAGRELFFGADDEGPFATYRLRQGEALYTAIVVRFTDFRENADILHACRIIQRRSGIRDVYQMQPGQKVLIPMDMLSDRYYPEGTEQRQRYEAALLEAERLKKQRVVTRDLEGVVVVLDPGHGGRDHGAPNESLGLYEDELNYDIACRIKRILETKTRAKIHMTLLDPSQGYKPVSNTRFRHDTDEVLVTTPHYKNGDATKSAHLRWYLANAIYQKELDNGADPRKIIFTSVHADALFNERLRGAMVYIPGAKYRRDSERPSGSCYDQFKEAREQRRVTTTSDERKRDEALSRNFAETLLEALGRHNPPIMRHKASDPIRSQIRQTGRQPYVVAVLRNTKIPTKILVETANMTNPTDCRRLADPRWREWFAEAYVDALKTYFGP